MREAMGKRRREELFCHPGANPGANGRRCWWSKWWIGQRSIRVHLRRGKVSRWAVGGRGSREVRRTWGSWTCDRVSNSNADRTQSTPSLSARGVDMTSRYQTQLTQPRGVSSCWDSLISPSCQRMSNLFQLYARLFLGAGIWAYLEKAPTPKWDSCHSSSLRPILRGFSGVLAVVDFDVPLHGSEDLVRSVGMHV